MPAPHQLRPLQPMDDPALARLYIAAPDHGRFTLTPHYHIHPYEIARRQSRGTVSGAAAVQDGRLAGAGMLTLTAGRVDGAERPYALLHSLAVHPARRRRGIAADLIRMRLAEAADRLGRDAPLVAEIDAGNAASWAAAASWRRAVLGERESSILPIRPRPARARLAGDGVTIRPAETAQMPAIAAALNRFYAAHGLYQPWSAAALADWLAATPFESPFRHYIVAADRRGNLLAGAALAESWRLAGMQVRGQPVWAGALNRLLRVVPPDGRLRQQTVTHFWYTHWRTPHALPAARRLWKTLRQGSVPLRQGSVPLRQGGVTLRQGGVGLSGGAAGTHLTISYDPRGPLPAVMRLPRWWPRARSRIVSSRPWRETPPLAL